MTERELFFKHLGLPSATPLAIKIIEANDIYLYDDKGNEIIDLCAGVSVSNLGHQHPAVVQAVKEQVDKYMHIHVYGEIIQSPQVQYAKYLTDLIPLKLNSIYFVNSGSEANEGALKLAKRYTGRTEIISFKKSYHGSTHGALSIMGDEFFKQAYRPLLPDIKFIEFNNEKDLSEITNRTACVIVEPVQAEAGVIVPENNYLTKLKKKCTEVGALLIFDEVQTGFGRTGKLFAFEKYDVVPDVLTVAKAMGGGMPIGAFISSRQIMESLQINPFLGHITTFGGHPVSAAAALASIMILIQEKIIEKVVKKEYFFLKHLKHKKIKSISHSGLLLGVELEDEKIVNTFISKAIQNGLITDSFLFAPNKFRIGPPLIITESQIYIVIEKICKTLDEI
jgi:acetylornithine/succinyldiaminopimelate/putrescine aminotransferase